MAANDECGLAFVGQFFTGTLDDGGRFGPGTEPSGRVFFQGQWLANNFSEQIGLVQKDYNKNSKRDANGKNGFCKCPTVAKFFIPISDHEAKSWNHGRRNPVWFDPGMKRP